MCVCPTTWSYVTPQNRLPQRGGEVQSHTNTKKLAQLSLFTAAALVLYLIELRLPAPVPIPGVKLGLANIITVVAVYRFSAKETLLLVLARVFLGTLFGGGFSALPFSLAGAVLCLAGMLSLKKIIPCKYIWLASILGAMLHNLGQIGAAAVVMGSLSVAAYLPVLLLSGGITGAFTGLCAYGILQRIMKNM